jgi:hypothetical protein
MPKRPEYGGAWPRIRKAILDRDGWVCQLCHQPIDPSIPWPKPMSATVDHKIPVTKGGSWWDESNLRAAHNKCNLSRVDHTKNDRWLNGKTRIVLVIGPPKSGKVQYVADHKDVRDLVIDYEAIAEALGGNVHDSTMVARNALITSLKRGEIEAPKAWLISANPHAESMFPHHEVVVIDSVGVGTPGGDGGHVARVRAWHDERSGSASAGTAPPSRVW